MILVNWKLQILWNTEKSCSSWFNNFSVIYFLWLILIQNTVVASIELLAINLLFPVGLIWMRRKGLKLFLLTALVGLIIVLVHSISKDIKTKPLQLGIIKAQGQFPRLLSETEGLKFRVSVRLYTGIRIWIWLKSQAKGQHKPLWSKWKTRQVGITNKSSGARRIGGRKQEGLLFIFPSPTAHYTWRQLLVDGDGEVLVVFWLLTDSISIRNFFIIS